MIFACSSSPCRCNTSQRGDTSCWCYLDEAVLECVRCKAPMEKQAPVPMPINIIASPGCAAGTAYLISFLGRKPECEKHDVLIGQPHVPCWSMVKAETSPGVAVKSGLREGQKVPGDT